MAGSPIRRARREGLLPPAPNPGAKNIGGEYLEGDAPKVVVTRVRARAKDLPTDAQLCAFAKAVLWDVCEMAPDPRDRSRAAGALIAVTQSKDAKPEDALEKLSAEELAVLKAKAVADDDSRETRQ